MALPLIFCILIGSLAAMPQGDDFRSNFEFFEYGSNIGDSNYRLADTVYPHTMNVDLDVYLEENRFNGLVVMGVEVRENGLTEIVFHQKVVLIETVNVVTSDNRVVNLVATGPFTTDDHFELLKINLAAPINVGNYTITIRYRGAINVNPIDRGFYKGYYFSNNAEVAYATTQFQPGNARKAFPCFDEPMFKSRYTLSITRGSNLRPSYSNMPIARTYTYGNRIREEFYPTPIISAYLIAFHVSDFVETELTSTAARPFKIISRPGVTAQHQFAADIGVRITNVLDDYFGILYHEMGQGTLMKNDHIALPDFPSGAMENWGMVNYREAYLLYDQLNTNLPNKIFIASIIAHELAHKWFGNLVTTFWWGNLWLNESFASYFEYFAAHWAHPDFELDKQFVVDYVHSALSADASINIAPMNSTEVADLPSISAHFSTSSYAKGASVLRTMEHFIGSRSFRLALRYYLREHAYGVGTNDDMFNAFRRAATEDYQFLLDYPNVDIGAVFESWVQNPGSPVLNVNFNNVTGVITVTQSRYVLAGDTTGLPQLLWHIPLTWTTETDMNFVNTRPRAVMSSSSDTFSTPPGNYWVLFNIAQSGLYRVNYDAANWNRLANYLTNSTRIHIDRLNRAQIVNDLLFFVRSRDINQTLAFTVLEFLKEETDYYVWKGAISQLEFILKRFEHLPLAHREFTNYLLDIMRVVIQHLGYDERETDSTADILNRMQIMNLACNLGHSGCVEDSLAKWRAHRNNTLPLVPVNARRYVYCVGLREGDATDYQFLFNKYINADNTADMVVILRALACTRDAASLNSYLQMSMQDRRIRIHDRTNTISFALQGNSGNLPTVLNFLYTEFTQIRTSYGGPDRLNLVLNSFSGFLTNYTFIDQFHGWVYENQLALGSSFNSGISAATTALNNNRWGSDNAQEIYTYLMARSSSDTFVASIILVLAAMFVQLFR